jgi:hypothetical protein
MRYSAAILQPEKSFADGIAHSSCRPPPTIASRLLQLIAILLPGDRDRDHYARIATAIVLPGSRPARITTRQTVVRGAGCTSRALARRDASAFDTGYITSYIIILFSTKREFYQLV